MPALGHLQWGECQRCGQRRYARQLVYDGRLPNLLVCQEGCYDPPHEADRPFVPNEREGLPKYPLAPELLPSTSPVLEGVAAGPKAWDDDSWEDSPLAWLAGSWSEGGVELSWTRPTTLGPRIERYDVFRKHANDSEFAKIDEVEVEYSNFMEVENEPEEYADGSAQDGVNEYYVEAVAGDDSRIRSNTVSVEVTA